MKIVPLKSNFQELLYGIHPISCCLLANSRNITKIFHCRQIFDDNESNINAILTECNRRKIEIVRCDKQTLNNLLPQSITHQGIAAQVDSLKIPEVEMLQMLQ